jgi:hypothetical protein
MTRRRIQLADEHLQREVSDIVFLLMSKAGVLKAMRVELEIARTDVANLHTFAENARDAVRQRAERIANSARSEEEAFMQILAEVEQLESDSVSRLPFLDVTPSRET